MNHRGRTSLVVLALLSPAAPARTAVPVPRISFEEAVGRALARNPSVRQAAAEILRAQGLLREAWASVLPNLGGRVVNTTNGTPILVNGAVATPRNQLVASLVLASPLFAPYQWALVAQAADTRRVTVATSADVKRQIATATAQAYLAVIARRRVLEANQRAYDVAQAHYDLARRLRENGAGSRLNELRAQQAASADRVQVEQSAAAVYAAQEGLGVLLAADGPLDAADEPKLDLPASPQEAEDAMASRRTDLRLASERQRAAERAARDVWLEYLPTISGQFEPSYTRPSTLFQPARTWRADLTLTVPLFEAGARGARRAEALALLEEARVAREGLLTQARSEVRSATDALARAQAALDAATASAAQAGDVLGIVNVSFQEGASTNIEVIDAQLAATDADIAAATAQDQVRQARLSLLLALGLFP